MIVNLKKAAALAAAVSATTVKFDHAFNIDPYGDPPQPEHIERYRENLLNQVGTAMVLTEIVFTIRRLIGEANVGRVNDLLTRRARVEKKLSILNTIPVRQQGSNLVAIARQVEALRGVENKPYGVKVPGLELETASLITPFLRELKKNKRDLDDELQAVNFNTTITLPEDVVGVLKTLDLV
jgi:hypothetical protein